MLRVYIFLLVLLILASSVSIILAQVPQLINYQGLLIDPAADQPVPDDTYSITFFIYDVSSGGSPIWTESQSVQIKDGLYNVLLGSTTSLTASILSGSEKYLGVKVGDDPEMTPRTRIVSVAYALVTESLYGSHNTFPSTGNVGIGITDNPSYKLHIHEKTSGNAYSSYTNATTGTSSGDGVLVGLDHDENFRIHTYEDNKIRFFINNSEKMQITNSGNVGIGISNPIEKLHVNGLIQSTAGFKFPDGSVQSTAIGLNNDNGVVFGGTYAVGTIPAEGDGVRFMWYPKKAALRAGWTQQGFWDDENIGIKSVAFGHATTASGDYSFVTGLWGSATGNASVAMGNSDANGDNSTALGYATANGHYSTAMGYVVSAESFASLALGRFNEDNGSSDEWVPTDAIMTIGDGTSLSDRQNLMNIKKNGNMWLQGSLTQNSDKQLKKNICRLNNTLDKLKQIRGVSFTWKETEKMGRDTHFGIIAQDVEKVYPELVGEEEGYKTTDYNGLIPVLIEAVKEQQEMIEYLQKRVQELEK